MSPRRSEPLLGLDGTTVEPASARSWTLSKAGSLSVLAACEVLTMSLWFSASAVVPVLKAEFGISGGQAAALSSSVAVSPCSNSAWANACAPWAFCRRNLSARSVSERPCATLPFGIRPAEIHKKPPILAIMRGMAFADRNARRIMIGAAGERVEAIGAKEGCKPPVRRAEILKMLFSSNKGILSAPFRGGDLGPCRCARSRRTGASGFADAFVETTQQRIEEI